MCTHGGTRYGSSGCRRTYLSQRDLQAHINHRHVSNAITTPQPMEVIETERQTIRPKPGDPRGSMTISTNVRQRPTPVQSTSGVRTNLITVPIQDSTPVVHEPVAQPQTYYNQYQTTPTYGQTLPPMHIPPPQQTQYYAAPPAYNAAQAYTPYTNTQPPAAVAYTQTAVPQTRPAGQYDYATASQWTSNQQYYR